MSYRRESAPQCTPAPGPPIKRRQTAPLRAAADGATIRRMGWLRFVERHRRLYLMVWACLAAVALGMTVGLVLPRALATTPTPRLLGDIVTRPNQIRAPDFHLHDQAGRMVSMTGLRGRVVALTFLDTQCLQMCPLQAAAIASAQSQLGSGAGLTVVVVSVRPDADTPAAIAGFVHAHGLAEVLWLNGTRSELSAVWNSYGVGVQVASGTIEHTSVIYLIDRAGSERVGFADVPDPAMLAADVKLLHDS